MMNLDPANFETNELLSARGLNRFVFCVFLFFLFFVFHLSISSIRQDSLIDDTHTRNDIRPCEWCAMCTVSAQIVHSEAENLWIYRRGIQESCRNVYKFKEKLFKTEYQYILVISIYMINSYVCVYHVCVSSIRCLFLCSLQFCSQRRALHHATGSHRPPCRARCTPRWAPPCLLAARLSAHLAVSHCTTYACLDGIF